nr:cupin domain-containing protein [Marinicella sp. W31]MDC2878854.1 cupin domain-containing protein [Marinicella sp. W31]
MQAGRRWRGPGGARGGDFVLLSATPAFTMSGMEPAQPVFIDPKADPLPDGAVRYGRQEGPADLRQFGGWFSFASPDAGLLVALLPRMIHIRGVSRLAQLVRLVGEEAAGRRSAANSFWSAMSRSC